MFFDLSSFMPKQESIQNTLVRVIVTATFLTTLLISSVFMYEEFQDMKKSTELFKEQLMDNIRTDLRHKTEMLWTEVNAIHDKEVNGLLSREQAFSQAVDLIRSARYDNGEGYFFCDTYEGVNVVLLGKKDIEGKSRIDATDSNGLLFVREVIKNGRQNGGGFTEMTFPKPNSTESVPKLNYSLAYDPYQIVFGTGVYIDWIGMKTAEEEDVFYQEMVNKVYLLLITIVIVTILSYIVAVRVSRSIADPILDICDRMKVMSEGDFREITEIEKYIKNKNEIGKMYQSLEELQQQVSGLICNIASSAEQVAAASEELTSSAEQSAMVSATVAESAINVAGSCTQQFEATESSTKSSDEMQSKMNDCTEILKITKQSIDHTHKMADNGKNKADNAMIQMNMIKESVNNSSEVIAELGNKSKEIGGIIDTISDIAEQTNLLALNAAIEASHAGEAGRGFAVVAEEIRKLAEQSREASDRISSIVISVREDTNRAVEMMNKSTERVESGTIIVNESSVLFGEIAATVETIVKNANSLSKNVAMLEISSRDIAHNIQEMDDMSKNISSESQTVSASTQELTASMHEIARASESLARMAGDLQADISKFIY